MRSVVVQSAIRSHLEFPKLVAAAELSAGPRTIVKVGCGAGNAIFPLLEQNRNPELRIHAFDYSSHAIKLVQVGFFSVQSLSLLINHSSL
ncbi:hypothetical protein EDB85DRAFT_2159429 [Lactarius pseudohatsudake]|nr:hypothetical protein EDB85DRAFT_2159429 [Lactarius pseudohatsudake]